ncbi:MAG: glycosyltransferase family 4 protein [Myxococcales bacterium]|nr:glycosyltransferase family 4 protein [Myxococcales bacterium]
MKVGWIVENASPFVYEEVAALRARGVQVSVASVFRPLGDEDWSEAFGSAVYYPVRGKGKWLLRALRNAAEKPTAIARVAARARRENAPYRLVALAAEIAKRARREQWSHVHGTFATFPAWVAWAVGELLEIPFSLTGHAYDVQEPRPWLPRILADCAFARAISSETGSRMMRLAETPRSRAKVRVAHLGVDTDRFAPSGERRRRGIPRVLCVARHVPEKGIADLLEATQRLVAGGASLRVELVGEGPLTPQLRRRARELGLLGSHVVFRGRCDRDRVRRALARATLFALPCSAGGGIDHDGLPVAILEAMACGLPIVTTAVGGISDAIVDGVNGCFVNPDDPVGLAAAIRGLLEDSARRERLGRGARATALQRFSARAAARRLDVLLSEPTAGSGIAASTGAR